jgi:hypothetical protein
VDGVEIILLVSFCCFQMFEILTDPAPSASSLSVRLSRGG